MITNKKIYSRLNADDDTRFLEDTDYINLENCVIAQNEFGKNFQVQNIPSTQLLFYYTSGLNTLGTAVDYQLKRLFWFDHNEDTGLDTLFCYDLDAQTTYRVIVSTQITGGLNLSKAFRIDRNFKIVNGEAIWTDDLNEPKSINIEAGLKLNQPSYSTDVEPYLTPIPYTTPTLIKRPPIYQLEVEKVSDAGFTNNFTSNEAFQFYYFYQYKNYQESANSVISDLIPFNFEDEGYNSVKIQIPFDEHIDDYVFAISLVVRYGNAGKSFVIYVWSKDNAYDLLSIESHNAGIVQLYYYFYNNKVGYALSDIQANTFFHSVALKAKTVEAAKNRIFLGDVLKGYNPPTITSLTLTAEAATTTDICFKSGSTYIASVTFSDRFKRPFGRAPIGASVTLTYRTRTQTTFVPAFDWTLSNADAVNEIPEDAFYYQICMSLNQARLFYVQTLAQDITYVQRTNTGEIVDIGVVYDNANTYAISVNIGTLLAVGEGYVYAEGDYATLQTQYNEDTLRVIGQDGNNVWLSPKEFLLTFSRYFYESSSTSNVWDDPNSYYFILDFISSVNPSASVSPSSVNTVGATGDIDNTDNHPVMTFTIPSTTDTKFQINTELSFKTDVVGSDQYTFQIRAVATHPTLTNVDILVYEKEHANGGENYEDKGFGTITIPAGYEKLFVYMVLTGAHFHLLNISITINSIVDINSLVEIFTPYKPSDTDPFYGVGEVMPITNATEISRQYSVLSGTIEGDSYIIDRTVTIDDVDYDFKVESMSPNDNVWQRWERNLGWPSFIDKVGQQLKETSIDWSDTFITGSKTNGLNNFQPLNTKDVGASSGSIQKLQLTNKMEENGTVMLVITDTDTLSAYLSEVQLYNAATVNALITTDNVIGSINALQNGQGTINPESVVEYNGVVWWINALKGIVAQYSNNGVINISDIKLRGFFDRFCKRYVALGKAGVDALCGFSHISACVDLSNGLYSLILPQTEEDSFAPILPSYLIGTGIWKYMVLYYVVGSTIVELHLYYIYFDDGSSYYPEIYQDPLALPLFVDFSDITAVGFSEVALSDFVLSDIDPPSGVWLNPQTPTYFDTSEVANLYQASYASSIQNRFSLYDGQPKIMNYDYNNNKWVGAYQWLPECQEYFGNKLFGFKDGFLYLHNESTTSYNNIYGVNYPQRICFTCNMPPSAVKDILNIALEANKIPNFTVLYSNYPNIQITDLTEDDYANEEGVMYARFYRDRLSPNTAGTAIDKMYGGDIVQGAVGYLMVEFEIYDEQLVLNLTNMGFEISKGQSNILKVMK